MSGHRRGRSSGPALSAHLRKALELAEGQVDVPVLARLEGVGVEYRDATGLIQRVQNSELTVQPVNQALDILRSIAEDDGDEDLRAGARELIEDLAERSSPAEIHAFQEAMHTAAVLGVTEGFVLGVAYALERSKTMTRTMRNRPKR